jgi:hypothetical protein
LKELVTTLLLVLASLFAASDLPVLIVKYLSELDGDFSFLLKFGCSSIELIGENAQTLL